MSHEPIIDQEAIENLRSLGDEEGDDSFLREVIEIFVSDTPVRLQELRTSHLTGDQATFTRAAHSIKGSSSNVGAQRLCRLAKELEAASRESLAGLEQRIVDLETSFAEAREALQAL